MKTITYDEVCNKLKEYCQTHELKNCQVFCDKDAKTVIKELKKRNLNIKHTCLYDMVYIEEFDNIIIYKFAALTKDAKENSFQVCIFDKKLNKLQLIMEWFESTKITDKIINQLYCVSYDDNGSIDNKIKLSTDAGPHDAMYDIKTYNKIREDDTQFNNNAYSILEQKGKYELLIDSKSNCIYLSNQDGFYGRINVIFNHTDQLIDNITSKLDELLENEKTKIYVPKNKQGQ